LERHDEVLSLIMKEKETHLCNVDFVIDGSLNESRVEGVFFFVDQSNEIKMQIRIKA